MTADEAIQQAALAYLPQSYKLLLRKLEEQPMDASEIATFLNMTQGSAYKLLMVVKELKVVCVVEYRRNAIKGAPIKVWGIGTKNVRPPPKITPAARSKAWRERNRPPTRPRKNKLDTFMKWATHDPHPRE